MICSKCGEDKKASRFWLGNSVCCKCIYEEKLDRLVKCPPPCRICKKECDDRRSVYCSDECAAIGIDKQKKDFWTRKVPSV